MCSSLTERVHVTLWSHGNAIPVHCSYHGVSSSLQQQTDQFKISCKARDAILLLLKSSISSPKPQIPAEELLQWEEEESPYQPLLPAVKEFQSNFPLHALRNLLPLLQHPAIARKKIHHLEHLGVSHLKSSWTVTNENLMLLVICKPNTMETRDMQILPIVSQRQIHSFFCSFYAAKHQKLQRPTSEPKKCNPAFLMGNGIRSVLGSNALEMD